LLLKIVIWAQNLNDDKMLAFADNDYKPGPAKQLQKQLPLASQISKIGISKIFVD